MIDFRDVTFLIPIRIDNEVRIENFEAIIRFIDKNFVAKVIVLEADYKEKVSTSSRYTKIFVEDREPIFHRTKYLNRMVTESSTPFLAIWDADVIGIPAQIEQAVSLLRNKSADMVYPYDRYFYSVNESIKRTYLEENDNISVLTNNCPKMGLMHGSWSVGGAFIVSRNAYIDAGMENVRLYGWGPEDAERFVRWDTLGYKIKRVEGPLFHLYHPVGKTSRFGTDSIELRNRKEFFKICSFSPGELKSYVDSGGWKNVKLSERDKCSIDFPLNPKTTWVIRTLNEEKWLRTVLQSLFLQSRLDFEIVVVDSGSTDGTLDILDEFPIRKLIKIDRHLFNYSSALNLGIREARGELIGILSGHSLPVSRKWYENAMENFCDKNVAAVTGSYTSLIDGSYEEKLFDLYFSSKQLKKQHYWKWMSNTNAIIRKDLWSIYPFDETLQGCEDYDWACEMLSRGYDVIWDAEFNVYHSHGGIGRPGRLQRHSEWKDICLIIDNKERPQS